MKKEKSLMELEALEYLKKKEKAKQAVLSTSLYNQPAKTRKEWIKNLSYRHGIAIERFQDIDDITNDDFDKLDLSFGMPSKKYLRKKSSLAEQQRLLHEQSIWEKLDAKEIDLAKFLKAKEEPQLLDEVPDNLKVKGDNFIKSDLYKNWKEIKANNLDRETILAEEKYKSKKPVKKEIELKIKEQDGEFISLKKINQDK